MITKLPTGAHETLTPTQVENFEWQSEATDGEYCYILLVDFHIPDSVKSYTDDFPLAMHKKVCGEEDHSPYTRQLIKNLKESDRKLRNW